MHGLPPLYHLRSLFAPPFSSPFVTSCTFFSLPASCTGFQISFPTPASSILYSLPPLIFAIQLMLMLQKRLLWITALEGSNKIFPVMGAIGRKGQKT